MLPVCCLTRTTTVRVLHEHSTPVGAANRRLETLALLQAQPGISASELAQRLGATERTARRDIAHLREDILKLDEPQLKAMFETSAEVLAALVKTFDDYERRNEAAWRR